jgi:hypothetical protein
MTILEFARTGFSDAKIFVRRHHMLVITLVVLFAIAGSTRYLRGDLLGGPIGGGGGSSSSAGESLRSCTSTDTIFEDIENLDEVRDLYRQNMSQVFMEREVILKTPSLWKCGIGKAGEPPIAQLTNLAEKMPGWHYYVTVPFIVGSTSVPVLRPVTFDGFGAIVAEFQREYECKLTELQDRNIAEVSRNQDISKPAQFCCIATEDGQNGCRQQENDSLCVGPLSSDPMCNDECPTLLYMSDLASRMPAFHDALADERETSRIAVERALNTMRSFEMNYAIARQLVCYERASLDLKNEMSLLADAVSCMPKIWDAVTSIHDKHVKP